MCGGVSSLRGAELKRIRRRRRDSVGLFGGLAKLSKFSCGLGFPWPCGSIERGTTSGGQTTLLMPEASFDYWRP